MGRRGILRAAVAKIRGRFHEVRAWNGIPGVDVEPAYAKRLMEAGVPVSVFTKTPAHQQKNFVGSTGWGEGPADDFDGDDSADTIIEVPEEKGYRVAVPLARLAPHAELTIWVAHNFTPDELDALYRLQEGKQWVEYLRDLRDQATTEDHA
jgi:hypothetical protein